MAKTKKIGVVTVTYNSATVLADFLESYKAQTHADCPLYVIDNASGDASVDIVRQSGLAARIIANDGNLGVAAANNQGIVAALADGCDAVLLINNDVVFPAGLFAGLVEGAEKYATPIVFPKMLYHDRPDVIWCAGGTFLKNRGWAALHYGVGERDSERFGVDREVEYSPTCCALIDASVFAAIGMMDERYFVYYDDTDFFFRAFRRGIRMMYLGGLFLNHKVSSLTGGGGLSNFAVRYMNRNRTYFLRKHTSGFALALWMAHLRAQLLRDRVRGKLDRDKYGIALRAISEGKALPVA